MTLFFIKLGLFAAILSLSAAFSLAETAFLSLSRLQLARLTRLRPGRLDFWISDPDRGLAALLLMNNLANAALGVLSISLALDAVDVLGLPFSRGGVAFPTAAAGLVILLGELAPKVAARSRPDAIALFLAPFAEFFSRRIGPIMKGVLAGTGRLLSTISRTVRTEHAQWDPAVLHRFLEKSQVENSLRRVLQNLVGFGHTPVTAVMVPRDAITAVDLLWGRETVVSRVLASGYSRVPVHRGSLDGVHGMVYAKDLLAAVRGGALIAVDDLVRPLPRVPEETTLAEILRDFRQGHHHMALVVDGRGRVKGLITLQDALEAIVGDIAQEPRVS